MSAVLETPEVATVDRRRGHKFKAPSAVLGAIPPLYGTENIPTAEKIVHLHYFAGNADWYITELDSQTGEAFGWAEVLAGCGEWGYIPLTELATLIVGPIVVERDLHWSPKPISEIERIPVYS
jgi:hypothetical protein